MNACTHVNEYEEVVHCRQNALSSVVKNARGRECEDAALTDLIGPGCEFGSLTVVWDGLNLPARVW